MTLLDDPPPPPPLDIARAFDPIDVTVAGVPMLLILEPRPGAPSRWTIGIRWPWGVREAGQA